MGPFLKVEYFIKNWFWLGENASKWSELHFTPILGGFMAILDPPQSRNWNFLEEFKSQSTPLKLKYSIELIQKPEIDILARTLISEKRRNTQNSQYIMSMIVSGNK